MITELIITKKKQQQQKKYRINYNKKKVFI